MYVDIYMACFHCYSNCTYTCMYMYMYNAHMYMCGINVAFT